MTADQTADFATLTWLLQGDAAVRWRTLELAGASASEVAAERAKIATGGWGARLLGAQDSDGRWAQALYSPKWTSTYTLLLLHWLGLPTGHPQALAGCQVLWDSARYTHRGRSFGGGLTLAKSIPEPETCITAMLVLLASSFGYRDPRVAQAVRWLATQQLADGGWNCETVRCGSRNGSFHTTISTLDGLLAYQQSGGAEPVSEALSEGRRFLLERSLFRSRRSGEVVDPAYLNFPFPPQWHYDIVRGLEHFRAANAERDPRLGEAVEAVRGKQGPDGRWRRQRPHPGRQWFTLEPAGPSRWATLRSLRLLRWWEG